MESPNTSLQVVELNPSCSRQTHLNRLNISPGHKITEPGRIFTVLCILFMVCPFRSMDAKCSKVVQKVPCSWHNKGIQILASLGEHLRTHLKDHARYDQGPKIHGKPKRVSLPVSEAQLAGCLKVWVSGLLEWDAGIQ